MIFPVSFCYIDTIRITATYPKYEFDIEYEFSEPDTTSTLLKADYDSLTLYLCRDQCITSEFTCYLKKLQFEMNETQLLGHPWVEEFYSQQKNNFPVDGEDFYEMSTNHEFYPCSVSYNPYEYNNAPTTVYKTVYNDSGLISELQEWTYHLLDELEEPIAKDLNRMDLLATHAPNYHVGPRRKRSETPQIKVLYRYEYEFYY